MTTIPSVEPLDSAGDGLIERSGTDLERVQDDVEDIVTAVRSRGDDAVFEYTRRFDEVDLEALRVPDSQRAAAEEALSDEAVGAIRSAAEAIDRFHRRQRPDSWIQAFEPGVEAGTLIRPLSTVGCYAPGGAARYPSSVLMTAIPAAVAGVDRIVVCTPPDVDGTVDPATRFAAEVAGVDDLFTVGGAQAVAAMAYGTERIPAVDKVVGPGNVYVTAAKRAVMTDVDIDVLAGPTELIVVADATADPAHVAWDLIAQSEHDPDCASILVTPDRSLAEAVRREVEHALESFERTDTVETALDRHGGFLVAPSLAAAFEYVNAYAPEHLQVMVDDADDHLDRIDAVGTVFLGHATSAAAGDYAIGPSHVLPTAGAARRRSGISVFEFVRTPTVQRVSTAGLEHLADTIETMADLEGLPGHAAAVRVRREGRDD